MAQLKILDCLGYRFAEFRGIDRLKQVIDGTCLQSLQSIFLVGSDEYDAVFLFGDRPKEGKTVLPRHIDIEKDEINFGSFQKFPSFSG